MAGLIQHPGAPGAYVLRNADGLMVADNRHPGGEAGHGWRRWVWTKSSTDAAKWGSAEAASDFAAQQLPGEWSPRPLKPTPQPAVG